MYKLKLITEINKLLKNYSNLKGNFRIENKSLQCKHYNSKEEVLPCGLV